MKKLLILALLFAGCGRYEDKGKKSLPYSCKSSDTRFDNWFGETTYNLNGKWYTKEEWEKTDTYKAFKKCDDNRSDVEQNSTVLKVVKHFRERNPYDMSYLTDKQVYEHAQIVLPNEIDYPVWVDVASGYKNCLGEVASIYCD